MTPADDEHTDLAVAWTLRVLDPDQEDDFLAHLAGCAQCAAVVAETSATLAVVAEAVPQHDPPPLLRDRLLAAVEQEVATGTGSARSDVRSDARGDGAAPEASEASVLPLRRRRIAGRALVAAAAAVAVLVIGGLVTANQDLRAERDQQAATSQEYGRVVDVMRDAGTPGALSAPLAAPGGALVGLVVDRGAGPEILATNFDPNRSDETYVLWALAGGAPRPLGTFDVPVAGASVASVPSGRAAGPVGGFAVSLEPGRSAPAAPTRIVASGQVGR